MYLVIIANLIVQNLNTLKILYEKQNNVYFPVKTIKFNLTA